MNYIVDFVKSEPTTALDRVLSNFPKINLNKKQLMSLIITADKINEYLQNNEIEDGIVGFREILEWVEMTDYTKNAILAAEYCIIPFSTNDEMEKKAVREIVKTNIAEELIVG